MGIIGFQDIQERSLSMPSVTQKLQVFKCPICGNIVEVLHVGSGELVCCGEPMILLTENTVDASKEKHVPVISQTADGVTVKVGSVPHPMEEKHYIEWIEVIDGETVLRRFLAPGQAPEAVFCLKTSGVAAAREYCNLHGLWKA
jgi:superoxide reductase